MSFKIGVFKNFANFIGKHQCWSMGASTKDVSTLGKGERGQAKAGKCGQREREELAKCGRPLIATIFVKFTQIIWHYGCI